MIDSLPPTRPQLPTATAREARLQNDGPFQTWPLWISDGRTFDQPDQAPLSEALKADLRAWTEFYQAHFDDAWDVIENADAYNDMGVRLGARVSAELHWAFLVLVNLTGDSQGRGGWVQVIP